ncbi:hypothetical protein KAR91_64955 [Candidatus Pacearchaeota archaeon]|nr:hypothetical protein [Candidatus Pacearchaeota archaeon]
MKTFKTLIPIAVVLLFLGIAFAPTISAQAPTNQTRTLTVWMPEITDDYKTQIVVGEEELENIENAFNNFFDVVEVAMAEGSPGDEKITVEEWVGLKDSAVIAVETVKIVVTTHGGEFPDLDIETYIGETIASFFSPLSWYMGRAPIFSLGRGFVWIPFYEYESFLGWMLRPMFLTHLPGFTAVVHMNLVPFRLEYADRLGLYRLRTIGFGGIFINLGDIGLDNIMGPVLMIGKGWNRLGEDIP